MMGLIMMASRDKSDNSKGNPKGSLNKGENHDPNDYGNDMIGLSDGFKSLYEDVQEYRKKHSYIWKVCNNCGEILPLENNHPTRGEGTRDTLILKKYNN